MQTNFPELTTPGALFRFAKHLEEAGAEILGLLAEAETGERAEVIARIAKKHSKRADEVERTRKEKLNETVLEPLTSMDGEQYVPPVDQVTDDSGRSTLREAALALEECSARFYTDAVDKAGPVLAEVRRFFTRLAKDNEKYASTLRGA